MKVTFKGKPYETVGNKITIPDLLLMKVKNEDILIMNKVEIVRTSARNVEAVNENNNRR